MEPASPPPDELTRELRALSQRVALLEQWVGWWAAQGGPGTTASAQAGQPAGAARPAEAGAAGGATHGSQAPPPARTGARSSTPPPGRGQEAPVASTSRPSFTRLQPDRVSFEELLGGRLLSWAGAVAVLLGVAFFVAVAIGRGWIDERTRILLAFAGCAALLGVGVWLHERRGRTQASTAMVGTATAGMFLTLTAASQLYDLVAVPAGLVGALLIGALTTALAVRWNSQTIAAVGVVGALLAPVLIDADPTVGTIAYEAVALAAAVAVLVWRRWDWLSLVAFAVTAPQLLGWALSDQAATAIVVVAALFWALYTAAGVGHDVRARARTAPDQTRTTARPLRPASAVVVAGSALVVGATGLFGLREAGYEDAGSWFVAGLALAHLGLGVVVLPRRRDLGLVLLASSLTLGDVAFGLLAGGPALAIGWAVSAVGLAGLARRFEQEGPLAQLALAAQLSLSIVHVLLFETPPGVLPGSGEALGGDLGALLGLTAAAFVCARLVTENETVQMALDLVALAGLAYATAVALEGAALVAAWAAQAAVLGRVHRRMEDPLAGAGAIAFLVLALLHTLFIEAPLDSLLEGAPDLLEAAVAIAAVAAAAIALRGQSATDDPAWRTTMEMVGAIALVYLGSVAIVSLTQGGDAFSDSGLQQGQALLSAFWALTGLGGLVYGLLRDQRRWRLAGLSLLLLTVAKVFVYDLAALDSLYRVLSFIALGLLLLAGAYAYQRMRPGPEDPGSTGDGA